MKRPFFPGWALAPLALAGCSLLLNWNPQGQPCGTLEDCLGGYVCMTGQCVPGTISPDAGEDAGLDGGGADSGLVDGGSDAGALCAPDASYGSDPLNCGRCGHDCLGGACLAGNCQPVRLAANQDGAWHLQVDATSVYWTDDVALTGTVEKASIVDGSGRQRLAAAQDQPRAIGVNGQYVYWSTWGGDAGVTLMPLVGGFPFHVANGTVNNLALNSGQLYWGNMTTNTVWGSALDGSGSFQLACTQSLPQQIVANDEAVYWTNAGDGTLRMGAPRGNCFIPSTTLFGSSTGPSAALVALSPDRLYFTWQNAGDAGLSFFSLVDGGATGLPRLLVPRLSETAVRMTADDAGVYWIGSATGKVEALYVGTLTPSTLATTPGAHDVVTDSSAVYWTVFNVDGGVYKVAK